MGGRRRIHLSPDGSVVVLDGNVYFGSLMEVKVPQHERPTHRRTTSDDDTDVTSVYNGGAHWRDVLYRRDLDGTQPERVMGGGWADIPFTLDVSWDKNVLIYGMEDGATREIALPGAKSGERR